MPVRKIGRIVFCGSLWRSKRVKRSWPQGMVPNGSWFCKGLKLLVLNNAISGVAMKQGSFFVASQSRGWRRYPDGFLKEMNLRRRQGGWIWGVCHQILLYYLPCKHPGGSRKGRMHFGNIGCRKFRRKGERAGGLGDCTKERKSS